MTDGRKGSGGNEGVGERKGRIKRYTGGSVSTLLWRKLSHPVRKNVSCHLAPPPLAAPPSPLLRCELRAQAPTPRCQHKSPSTSNQLGANEELAVNLHPPPGLIKPHLRPSATATLGFPLFMKGHMHATGKFIPFKHFILHLNFKFSPLSKQFFHLSFFHIIYLWNP